MAHYEPGPSPVHSPLPVQPNAPERSETLASGSSLATVATPVTIRDAHQKSYSHVVDWNEGGKRRRKFFHSYRSAELWSQKKSRALGAVPRDAPLASPDELLALIEARKVGVPLMEAIHHWRRTIGAAGDRTVADLITARLDAAKLDGLSAKHMASLELKLGRFRESCGHLRAASVTAEDLAALVYAEKSHGAQKHTRAILSSVFMHAIRMGWLQFNPAVALKPQRKLRSSAPPDIFTPESAHRWLSIIHSKAASCFPGWAIAMFAGLRRSEVERLDWSEVKLDRGHIEVTAQKSKTAARRIVTIEPNLLYMLAPYWQPEGRVFPLSPKRAEAWARKEYGSSPAKNSARHSFVSYHLALYGDLALTEMQAGHDRKVLFQHYRELVTQADAAGYFGIVV